MGVHQSNRPHIPVVRLPLDETIEGTTSKAVSRVATLRQEVHTAAVAVVAILVLRKFVVRFTLNSKN